MAKKSMIEREKKRAKIVNRFAAKRLALKKVIADSKSSDEERRDAMLALQKLPRNASPSRMRNRCSMTGRTPLGSATVGTNAVDNITMGIISP